MSTGLKYTMLWNWMSGHVPHPHTCFIVWYAISKALHLPWLGVKKMLALQKISSWIGHRCPFTEVNLIENLKGETYSCDVFPFCLLFMCELHHCRYSFCSVVWFMEAEGKKHHFWRKSFWLIGFKGIVHPNI